LTLESVKQPTLHLVWLWHQNLLDGLAPSFRDLQPISFLKKRLLNELQLKFILDIIHKVATFLHPSFKRLHDLSSVFERQEIKRHVTDLLRMQTSPVVDNGSQCCCCCCTGEEQPPPAKRSATDVLFRKFGSEASKTADGYDNELEKYGIEDPGDIENVLDWWKESARKYPRLSRIARRILAIPASSSASESVFSIAGGTITDLRSNLAPETLHSLLFLHYNAR